MLFDLSVRVLRLFLHLGRGQLKSVVRLLLRLGLGWGIQRVQLFDGLLRGVGIGQG